MLTYQDLEKALKKGETAKTEFILAKINEHETSEEYKNGVLADEYDRQMNRTTETNTKYIKLSTGKVIEDKYSPNHKIKSNFYNRFTNQLLRYLLSNGATFDTDNVKKMLGGDDYDNKLMNLAKKALNGARSFGFWNYDHIEVFPVYKSKSSPAVFAPIEDEETAEIRGGIRYWQIDYDKPLIATLYLESGAETWRFRAGNQAELIKPQRNYVTKTKSTKNEGIIENLSETASSLPIFPLWGNDLHQSEIVGMVNTIDAYDSTLNSFANDCQSPLLYFTVRGAMGMDIEELADFIETVRVHHVLNPQNDQEVTPTTVEPPSQAREILLERLKNQLYEDFGALNVNEIKAGNVTATQILAAYEALDLKASGLETQILDFEKRLLTYLGYPDVKVTHTRSKLINRTEMINALIQSGEYLKSDYVTKKVLEMFDDGDIADTMIDEMHADEQARFAVTLNNAMQSAQDTGGE